MTYSEKLKDPRWQKKRLEILERDGWRCLACGNGNSTLHVHHCEYLRGCDPWENDNDSLVTLCEDCHTTFHWMIKREPAHWIVKQSNVSNYNTTLFYIYIMRSLYDIDNKGLKNIIFNRKTKSVNIKEVLRAGIKDEKS